MNQNHTGYEQLKKRLQTLTKDRDNHLRTRALPEMETNQPKPVGIFLSLLHLLVMIEIPSTSGQVIYQPPVGIYHGAVEGLIIYEFYVPLIFDLPGVPTVPEQGLPRERYCVHDSYFKREQKHWHSKGHQDPKRRWLVTSSRECYLVNKIYDMIAEKRRILRLTYQELLRDKEI